jgi:hypothetical protein
MADRLPTPAALRDALTLALSALPDSETAGPDGTGYRWAWDELTTEEQAWVKAIRLKIRALVPAPPTVTRLS